MSCYFIAQISIHDYQKYKLYEEGFDGIINNYDGKVIVVDDRATLLEGDWQHKRMVIIRFSDEAEAQRWYHSPEYQALAKYRKQASVADIVLVKGRE